MAVAERIKQCVERLPEKRQAEVLDFAEYLLMKTEREMSENERDWSHVSLAFAMRGMENEPSPDYTTADLKESFE